MARFGSTPSARVSTHASDRPVLGMGSMDDTVFRPNWPVLAIASAASWAVVFGVGHGVGLLIRQIV